MKLLVVVALSICVAVASAQCTRGLSGAASSSTSDARLLACQTVASPGCTIPESDELVTSNPLSLVIHQGAGSPSSSETRFFNNHIEIFFKESAKYYGKASEGPSGFDGADAPKVVFGTNDATVRVPATVFVDHSVDLQSFDSLNGCGWTHFYKLNWENFLIAYGGSAAATSSATNSFVRSVSGTVIRYDIDFNVYNYEWVKVARPGGADISVERVIRHALPFAITFQTQAAIVSAQTQVYSTITSLAAIVSQSVTLVDFSGKANANILLYTSIQKPFVIDELRVVRSTFTVSGRTIGGDAPADVTVSVGGQALNAYASSSATYNGISLTQTVDASGLASVNGGSGNSFSSARTNTASGGTCEASDALCNQVWPIGLTTDDGSEDPACDFTGSYYVYFTIRCHPSATFTAPDECPINQNLNYDLARIIPGSETAAVGTNVNFFRLDITSSNHCPTIVDTIGLSAKLHTHGQPLNSDPAGAVQSAYGVITGTVPKPAYGTFSPVLSTGTAPSFVDPDGIAWGPENDDLNAELNFDVANSVNGKTAFLNGQWVFGVASVKVQQATVVKASFDSLTLSGFGAPNDQRSIVSSGAIDVAWTGSVATALQFKFVDDTTPVNINTQGHRIAYPYFFFQVDQTALNIAADSNKQLTFEGTIKVTYQNSASLSGEMMEKVVPFQYSLLANTKSQGSAVSTSIGIGNAGTGSASTANSTFLGVSSSTAAGVALAVGVVVGLLVGLLVSATRRRPAPTKTESQVQLTNSAATSAV